MSRRWKRDTNPPLPVEEAEAEVESGVLPLRNTSVFVPRPRLWPAQLKHLPCYRAAMNLKCLIGLHRPSLTTIARRGDGFTALCEGCPTPLGRRKDGHWAACSPLMALAEKRAR
jgi:hypothetical protein